MSKFIIVSPEFGAFRSGEPVAYKLATAILKDKGNIKGTGIYHKDGYEVIYEIVGNTISVRFTKDKVFNKDPFVFEFVEIKERKVVDITEDEGHINDIKSIKSVIDR